MHSALRTVCLLLATTSAGAFFCTTHFSNSMQRGLARPILTMTDRPEAAHTTRIDWKARREVLGAALRLGACGCAACFSSPRAAIALAQLVKPDEEAIKEFDIKRDDFLDARFACGMATGMGDYEEAASARKARLFRTIFSTLPRKDAVIAEVGMGSFPNAPYFSQTGAPAGMDIIGIDPNDKMENYARLNARKARLTGKPKLTPTGPAAPNTLRVVHGVSEALPLEDASCDAVICTLTLCSVVSPERSVAEIKRVLKPGGKFLFWEHVLSETDEDLRRQQIALTPAQVRRADGCHLDRRTGETIKTAFSDVNLEYFELSDFGFLNPTVAGIATA